MGRLTGTIINMFDLSETEGAGQGRDHEFTAEDLANGHLCYFLNGTQDNIYFYQTLGEDAYPVPFDTHKRVYFQGEQLCDGTPTGEGTYTNDETTATIPSHTYPDGDFYCSVCGHINENFCEKVDA